MVGSWERDPPPLSIYIRCPPIVARWPDDQALTNGHTTRPVYLRKHVERRFWITRNGGFTFHGYCTCNGVAFTTVRCEALPEGDKGPYPAGVSIRGVANLSHLCHCSDMDTPMYRTNQMNTKPNQSILGIITKGYSYGGAQTPHPVVRGK